MEQRKGIVYCAKNKINGKCYIGETISKLHIRKSHHKANSIKKIKNSAFYNAIRKYGWNNFEWSILEENIDFDKLLETEADYIIKENTLAPNGYNLKYDTHNKRVITDELREKFRVASTGRLHSDKTKQQISKSRTGKCLGKDNGFYGKDHSIETKNSHSHYNQTIYYFRNKLTKEEFKGKVFEFCKEFNISTVDINTIKIRKEANSKVNYFYKGWSIYSTQEDMLYWVDRDNPKKVNSEETKKKMSDSKKGSKNAMFGKELSESQKKSISESLKGKSKSKNSKRYDQTIYTLVNKNSNESFTGKIYGFCEKHEYNISMINRVKNKGSYKGWYFKKI